MANEQNLKIPTSSEARENGRRGGKASGEARRRKKLLRECLEELLEREMTDKSGNTVSGAEALAVKLFKKAMDGNVKAFEVLRDTSGQKPVEKNMVADVEPAVIAEVEAMVNGKAESS